MQRNLLTPIEEMGLDIRVETRTGDTPSDRKARQRERPPQMLLTTPESLSLLLSYPDSCRLFAGLRTIVIDEVHAFATGKRGDLLQPVPGAAAALAPGAAPGRAVGDRRRSRRLSRLARARRRHRCGGAGRRASRAPRPTSRSCCREGRVPWSGHSGRYAAPQVMAEIETHRTTLVFCNTRSLAELIFQDLWKENEQAAADRHPSRSAEPRGAAQGRRRRWPTGRLRALVATASLDLGVDWGDVDLVIQMGAPKGSSRLLQRIGRANHRLDEADPRRCSFRATASNISRRAPRSMRSRRASSIPTSSAPGALDVLAQHIMAVACAGPFAEAELLAEIRCRAPYAALTAETFERVLDFIGDGGYALRAYDRFKRLTPGRGRACGASAIRASSRSTG